MTEQMELQIAAALAEAVAVYPTAGRIAFDLFRAVVKCASMVKIPHATIMDENSAKKSLLISFELTYFFLHVAEIYTSRAVRVDRRETLVDLELAPAVIHLVIEGFVGRASSTIKAQLRVDVDHARRKVLAESLTNFPPSLSEELRLDAAIAALGRRIGDITGSDIFGDGRSGSRFRDSIKEMIRRLSLDVYFESLSLT